ncbi:MAG: LAGLIDADG family homing endonuclease [Candidatus Aenigmatarchaeota archaeon]
MVYIKKLILQGFKSFNRKTIIPFLKGLNLIVGPNGSGKCIDGKAQILLANGKLERIEEIVEKSFLFGKPKILENEIILEGNPLNIEVLSLNPFTLEIEKSKVKAFIKRKVDKVFEIKTKTGREIRATSDHPFFTIENSVIKSVSAKELKVGTKIAIPRRIRIKNFNDNLTVDFKLEDKIYVPYSKKIENILRKRKKELKSWKKVSEFYEVPISVIKGILNKQSTNFYYLKKILEKEKIELQKVIKEIKCKNQRKKIKVVWKMTKELARFLGYLISEGSSLKSSSQIRFPCSSKEMIKDFLKISKKLFNVEAKVLKYKKNCYNVIIYSSALQKYLERVFGFHKGINAKNKSVSYQILTSSNAVISNFLSALIDGDGYISKDKICLTTKNKELANSIITLLLRFGIVGFLREKKVRKKKYYVVSISGIDNVKKIAKFLNLKNEEKRKRINEIKKIESKSYTSLDIIPNVEILFRKLVKELKINVKKVRSKCPTLAAYYEKRCQYTRKGLKRVLNFILKNYKIKESGIAEQILLFLYLLATSDIYWDEITEIKEIKNEQWVYDLTINPHHNFIANNIIVHNSNIIDAICFVLGKISAKQMRAEKLSELIFKGNEKKKAAEVASVTLILDNTERKIPIDADEVSITRKVNRKGYTLYKINGETVTRERVLEILSSVNLRPDGYNIILQGDVAKVIEMSEKERRSIIDQLSGIYEYNERKEKALQDLEKIENRLKEIELVINEKYKRYKEVEEQRNLAIKYRELEKQLNILRKSIIIKKIENLQFQINKNLEEIRQLEEQINKINEQLEKVDVEIEKKEKEFKKVFESLEKIKEKAEYEKLSSELIFKRNLIETYRNEIQRLISLIDKLQTISEEEPLAVKEILSLNIRGVYGTIASLMKVEPEYEIAIRVAAANHLFDIVVEDFETAKFCIEFLKREKIGRATFLPLDKIQYKRIDKYLDIEGVIGVASDLIKFDKKFEPAFEFVFGNTLIIKDLEVAKRVGIGKVRMVTLDGDLIERSGAVTGGYLVKKALPKEREIEEYRKRIKELEEKIKELEAEVMILEQKLKKIKVSSEITLEVSIDEKELEKLRKERKKLVEEKINLQNKISSIKIKNAKIEAEIENLRAELEKYKDFEYIDKSLEELEKTYDKVYAELKTLGPINFKAIDEYEKIKQEFEVLKQKFDKIVEEKRKIIEMINEIERKRREVFYNTLNIVSYHFNRLFNSLIGGEAKLELENPEDLDSGLLIKVKFPNKGFVELDSLSGGEKSLVSLLFLLSLQMYKPTPFYALDEVDAALDKINSERVANLLKEISKNTQLIVISHNDVTIKYADVLYGVTMEDGESKILTLKI